MVVEFRFVTKIENILSDNTFINSRNITTVLVLFDVTVELIEDVVIPFDGSEALSFDFIIELIKFDCPINDKNILPFLHPDFFPLTLPSRIKVNLTELKCGLIP